MTIEKNINIDGAECPIVISDEPSALLAAKDAGRVVVGLGKRTEEGGDQAEWLPVEYVSAGFPEDEAWLEYAARRQLGIPLKIAETERLIIREFSADDCARIPSDEDDSPDEAILKDPERLKTYIKEQYAFFDCGMWAVIRKEGRRITGMVSLTPDHASDVYRMNLPGHGGSACALGYHIYSPYRGCGYAKEACAAITQLLSERGIDTSAYADPENTASVALLKSLGFVKVPASFNCFLHLNSV